MIYAFVAIVKKTQKLKGPKKYEMLKGNIQRHPYENYFFIQENEQKPNHRTRLQNI